MPSPFAHPPREPAGPRETPAVLQPNGGTAAGSVGVAVPLSLVCACPASATCADASRSSAYFAEAMIITTAFTRDDHGGGCGRESVGANFTNLVPRTP